MKVVASIISACNFSCLIVLLVMSAFHDSLVLPDITILAGRFHVLFLHLPIGGIFTLVCLRLLKNQMAEHHYDRVYSALLSVMILVSLFSAITGLWLAEAGDYSAEATETHRLAGVTFAVLLYGYGVSRKWIGSILDALLLVLIVAALVFTSHQGGSITHGVDFLKLTLEKETWLDTTQWQKQPLFESFVMPIIKKKCVSCHSEEKSKGDLILTDARFWHRGGRNGALLISGELARSLIINRITLPTDDENHMPPKGKPQLSQDEIELIRLWIHSGADYQKTLEEYHDNDALMAVIAKVSPQKPEKDKMYTFRHAPAEIIHRLNGSYVSVKPLYEGSPALSASFFVASAYRTTSLESLQEVKEQLVHLNLSNMPLARKDMEVLARFKNLEKLHLNNTPLADQDLLVLQELPNLMQLSVIQCELSPEIEKLFNALPKLEKVYLGSPKLHESTLNVWKRKFPEIDFSNETGVNETLPLTPPIFQNERAILEVGDSIRLIHPVKGAHIWYTTDGTTPDSMHGKRYQVPFAIHQMAEIKALAVKEGWITSQPVTFNAYTSSLKPEKIRMISQSASQYPGIGESTFINRQLATISNTRDANWIGYREEPCIVEVAFDTAVAIQKVALNFACHIPQYIFPPTKIKVFGGPNSQSMKLLGTKILKAVTPAEKEEVAVGTSQVILTGKKCRVYRIEAYNLPVIPLWHPGKGEKGWLFIDEIFFYN